MKANAINFEAVDAKLSNSEVRVRLFEDFYFSQIGHLTKMLGFALGDMELGKEAADEAMTRAFERWSTVSGYDNPEGWVFQVGLNWSRSYLKRLRRKLPVKRNENVAIDSVADPALWQALRSLSVELRSVVVCRHLADWSTARTADALKLSEGAVKTRLRRALKELRLQLTDETVPTRINSRQTFLGETNAV